MDEFATFVSVVIVFVIVAILISYVINGVAEMTKDSTCRDNGYPDAVHVKTKGWYCVGLSESGEIYLVDYALVYDE